MVKFCSTTAVLLLSSSSPLAANAADTNYLRRLLLADVGSSSSRGHDHDAVVVDYAKIKQRRKLGDGNEVEIDLEGVNVEDGSELGFLFDDAGGQVKFDEEEDDGEEEVVDGDGGDFHVEDEQRRRRELTPMDMHHPVEGKLITLPAFVCNGII